MLDSYSSTSSARGDHDLGIPRLNGLFALMHGGCLKFWDFRHANTILVTQYSVTYEIKVMSFFLSKFVN